MSRSKKTGSTQKAGSGGRHISGKSPNTATRKGKEAEERTMRDIDEDDDPLDVETDVQREFREDMENAGIRWRTYSGRGMYGHRTYGVTCYDNGGRSGNEPTEQDVYRATEIRLRHDSMGLGTILYV